MQRLPLPMISPLVYATDEHIERLKLSTIAKPFFNIEGVRVLDKWPGLFDKIKPFLNLPDDSFPVADDVIHQLSFFFHEVSAYIANTRKTPENDRYYDAVDFYFKKLRKIVGTRDGEELFWKAFPEAKVKTEG